MGIPRGRGVSQVKFFKQKYDTKMEFPEGWGALKQGLRSKSWCWFQVFFSKFPLSISMYFYMGGPPPSDPPGLLLLESCKIFFYVDSQEKGGKESNSHKVGHSFFN